MYFLEFSVYVLLRQESFDGVFLQTPGTTGKVPAVNEEVWQPLAASQVFLLFLYDMIYYTAVQTRRKP